MPLGTEKSWVDGVVAVSDIYPRLLSLMKDAAAHEIEMLSETGKIGISWGSSGGEASGLINDNYLAADGIENVIRVLEDLEDEKFRDVDFIELDACSGGCVGGVLNVENPYVAKPSSTVSANTSRSASTIWRMPTSSTPNSGKISAGIRRWSSCR